MIDRGFAVAREGTYTIKDTHDYSKLCLIGLNMERDETNNIVTVTLSSLSSPTANSYNAGAELTFQLTANFGDEAKDREIEETKYPDIYLEILGLHQHPLLVGKFSLSGTVEMKRQNGFLKL